MNDEQKLYEAKAAVAASNPFVQRAETAAHTSVMAERAASTAMAIARQAAEDVETILADTAYIRDRGREADEELNRARQALDSARAAERVASVRVLTAGKEVIDSRVAREAAEKSLTQAMQVADAALEAAKTAITAERYARKQAEAALAAVPG